MKGLTLGVVLRLIAGLVLGVLVAYGGQYAMQTTGSALIFLRSPGTNSIEGMLYFVGFQAIILGTATYIAYRVTENKWVAAIVAVADLIFAFIPLR